jgi:hypothetical protein
VSIRTPLGGQRPGHLIPLLGDLQGVHGNFA